MKFFGVIVTVLWLSLCGSVSWGENQVEVGIVEKLGESVPMDLTFFDEEGRERPLRDFIDKPTVLALVYFRCPGICGPLLNGLKLVLDQVDLEPGQDFKVLTVSFDHREGPAMAKEKRKNYLQQLKRPFPEEAWRFLTGNEEHIRKLTDAVGFKFQRDGNDYRHAGTLIVLSPEGKITRYLLGISYLPFDLKMAVIEASEGKVGPTIAKWLLYCYSYDPEGKKYGIRVIRIAGVAVVLCLFGFILFLTLKGKKKAATPDPKRS